MTDSENNYSMPSNKCLQYCCKIAVTEDKPIMLDYWTDSLDKKVLIGIRKNGEKLLVKSEDEYTSPVSNIYSVENEYIIVTENSIYVASSSIPTRRISS